MKLHETTGNGEKHVRDHHLGIRTTNCGGSNLQMMIPDMFLAISSRFVKFHVFSQKLIFFVQTVNSAAEVLPRPPPQVLPAAGLFAFLRLLI